jgi:hypothetical protein
MSLQSEGDSLKSEHRQPDVVLSSFAVAPAVYYSFYIPCIIA